MFQVQNALISSDIATAKFACHLTACKGACCVVGDAGAPVTRSEVPILNDAFDLLIDELSEDAVNIVVEEGLIKQSSDGLELACVNNEACVFVTQRSDEVALCAIQKAFYEGKISWEKPLSCHLFPIRIMNIGTMDFLNFEFVPEICTPGAEHGNESNTYLAEYLETPLTRKYGAVWYAEFLETCKYIRGTTETVSKA
jgi:hypothetical protein